MFYGFFQNFIICCDFPLFAGQAGISELDYNLAFTLEINRRAQFS